MSEIRWLVNTAAHKRWWLPDGKHAVNSVIYGNQVRMSVILVETGRTYESVTFDFDKNPNWQELCNQFSDLAAKKYPYRPRHKSNEARDRAFQIGHETRHKKGFY
jgi:hypothetical protein